MANSRASKDLVYKAMGLPKYMATTASKTAEKVKNAFLDMPTSAGTGTYHSLTPRETIAKVKGYLKK